MKKIVIRISFVILSLLTGVFPSFAAKDYNIKNDTNSFLFVNGTSGNVGIGTAVPISKLDLVGAGTTSATSSLVIRDSNKVPTVTVLDDGNVGIGTTSPLAKLQVGGPASFNFANLKISGSTVRGYTANVGLFVNNTGGLLMAPASSHVGAAMQIGVSLAEASSGNHPLLATLILLKPSIGGGGATVTDAATLYIDGAPTATVSGQNYSLLIDSGMSYFGGNIGIGTTAPRALLEVGTTAAITAGSSPAAVVKGNLVVDGKIYGDGSALTNLTSSQWTTAGNNIYYNTGNVGIGTTNPGIGLSPSMQYKLHIKGSGAGTEGRTAFVVENSSADSAASFMLRNSVAGEYLEAFAAGPSYAGGHVAGFGTNGIDMFFGTDGEIATGGSSNILFSPGGWNNGPTMVITAGNPGNVGIGTIAPLALLQVGINPGIPVGSLPAEAIKGNLVVDGKIYGDGSQLTGISGAITGLTATRVPVASGSTTIIDSGIYYVGGNVGIGTSEPHAQLDIGGRVTSSVLGSPVALLTGDVNNISGVEMSNRNTGTSNDFRFLITDSTGHYFAFSQGGLNNTSLLFGLPKNSIDSIFSAGGTARDLLVGSGGNNLILGAGYNEIVRITNSPAPRLSIGTTEPGSTVEIAHGTYSSFSQGLRIRNTVSSKRFLLAAGASGNDDVFAVTDINNSAVRLLIDTSGNIGIGTTTPVARLHIGDAGSVPNAMPITGSDLYVKGNIELDGKIYGDGSQLTGISGAVSGLTATRVPVASGSTTIVDSIIYSVGGNVGIGTASPASKFFVYGSSIDAPVETLKAPALMGAMNANIWEMRASDNSLLMYVDKWGSFLTGGTIQTSNFQGIQTPVLNNNGSSLIIGANYSIPWMTFQPTGNIGIGTTAPLAKFVVAGTGVATGRAFEIDDNLYNPKVVVLDNGNIGIGTTSPISALQVTGKTILGSNADNYYGVPPLGDVKLALTNTAPFGINKGSVLTLGGSHITGDDLQVAFGSIAGLKENATNNNGDGYLAFYTNLDLDDSAHERLRITSLGNVGVGTTVPQAKLEVGTATTIPAGSSPAAAVKGNLVVDGKIYGDGSQLTGISGAISGLTATHIPVASGSTTIVDSNIYNVGGNVGIGTTEPLAKLEIVGDGAAGSTTPVIVRDSNELPIFTIWDDASVGIGSTIPTSALDISQADPMLRVYASTNDRVIAIKPSNGFIDSTNTTLFLNRVSAENIALAVGGGNVGIGTNTTAARLDLIGSGTTSATSALVIRDANKAAKVTILDDGNVGIGTAGPYAPLHVGTQAPENFFASGDVDAYGQITAVKFTDTGVDNDTISNYTSTLIDATTNSAEKHFGIVSLMATPASLVNNLAYFNAFGAQIYHRASSTLSTLYAYEAEIDAMAGAGSITSLYPYDAYVYTDPGYTQTISDFTGYTAWLDLNGGTVTNSYGVYVAMRTSGTGTITNAYGIYLEALPGVTGSYAIYQEGTDDWNYFAGNVGIGTAEPSAKLDISDAGSVPNAMSITGSDAYIKGNLEVDGKIYGDGSQLTNLASSQWTTNGTSVYYNTGNVGIGTAAPGGKVHIYTGSSGAIADGNADDLVIEGSGSTGLSIIAPDGLGEANIFMGSDIGSNDGRITYTSAVNTLNLYAMDINMLSLNGDRNAVLMNVNVGIGSSAPVSRLDVKGSLAFYRVAKAASATTAGETIIGVTDTSAARTITLATADVKPGRIIIIKDESGGAATNNITIATQGTEAIDGDTSDTALKITANYGVVRLYSNGTNWFTF